MTKTPVKNIASLFVIAAAVGAFSFVRADERAMQPKPAMAPANPAMPAAPAAAPAQPAMPAAAAPSQPAPATDQAVTLTGEVLDMACYLPTGAGGKGHADCAKKCLKGGAPAGLMQADGSVVFLLENHKNEKAYKMLKDFAGDQAKVSGKMAERGGARALVVDKVEKAK